MDVLDREIKCLFSSTFRNAVRINATFWVAYFVLSFFFKNGIYVDIMTVFKEKNKDKRSSQNVTVIFSAFLTS